MSEQRSSELEAHNAEIPLGQRFFDNWPLLMILGIVIMLVIYTGWGLWEITTMQKATLP